MHSVAVKDDCLLISSGSVGDHSSELRSLQFHGRNWTIKLGNPLRKPTIEWPSYCSSCAGAIRNRDLSVKWIPLFNMIPKLFHGYSTKDPLPDSGIRGNIEKKALPFTCFQP